MKGKEMDIVRKYGREYVFYFVFAFYIIRDFIDSTMFQIVVPAFLSKGVLCITFLLALFTVSRFNEYEKWQKWTAACMILTCFTVAGMISSYHFLIYLGSLIVAAHRINFDKILGLYLKIETVLLAVTIMAVALGFIENLAYVTWNKGIRNSFGFIYPTDFCAHILFLFIIGSCYRNRKISFARIIVGCFCVLLTYKACGAYTTTICLLIWIVGSLVEKICTKKVTFKIIEIVSMVGYVVILFVSIVLPMVFSKNSAILAKIDSLLTSRLEIGNVAIAKYGFSLWGKKVLEKGAGGTIEIIQDYFFIDNSFLKVMIEYGVVLFVIIIFAGIICIRKAYKKQRYLLILAIVVVTLHSFMEHHFLEIAYNPFLLLAFSELTSRERENTIFIIEN